MSKKLQLSKPMILVIVLAAGVALWYLFTQYQGTLPSFFSSSPRTVSEADADMDDLAAEMETLDTNFETDLQKLDVEVQGL